MKRFVITFSVVLVALFSVEMLNPVQEHVIVPFTSLLAKISAALIAPFDDTVIAFGKVLQFRDSGFAVSIEAGCNGVEATIVLLAAVVAYPASWKARISAILLGFLAIQALNIVRIITLFYLGDWDLDIFSWVHLYLWPALIMLDVLVVFILYLRYLANSAPEAAHAPAT
ncbi:exosortase H [Pseudohalioglobus lutimaris]|uniref:Exosortase H n=1 Tax=Pseudohalioglobus lutimaris TaxID=1737061 RepID=A0A2N5X228_9GAMM|nr:exosortase H [Pseudohalioglobus lutimaris]PLW68545.1 exosortase H [Pseudohalioglobus lutimaris]